MSNNRFTLPKMQTESREINQLQDNIIGAINKAIQSTLSAASAIGEQRMSPLTEAQFQEQMGIGWVLADGRNVTGSKYQKISGNNTVPDASTTMPGMLVNFYIRIN